MLLLGLAAPTVPTFISWLVGLYVLKMDPIILAGAVAGARNSTTAMRAISDAIEEHDPVVRLSRDVRAEHRRVSRLRYLAMLFT